jgi:tape measure protein
MSLEHLEFLLDLDAKVDGVVNMLDVLNKSVAALHKVETEANKTEATLHKMDHASEHATRTHERHGASLWQLGHHFEYVKNGIHEFAEALGLVLAFEVLEKLVDKVKELGEEIIHAAAKAERAEKSFSLLLGVEGAEELLGYLEKITNHTEFANEKLRETAASLLRVGFAGEDLHRAMAAALDIAALPGGNIESALFALEQAKRTGKVENRTLRGLGFGEKDFLSQLSSRTGKPSDVLKKEMEKGKLDVTQSLETLYDLIHRRTGKALGAAGVAMSETLGARITHLKDVPEEIFKTLSKSEAFGRFSAKVGAIVEMLNPKGEIGGKLAKSLETLATRAVDVFEHIDFKKVGDYLVDFLEKLPARLETASEVLSVFASVFKTVAWFVDGVGTSIGELVAKIYLASTAVIDWVTGLYDTVVNAASRLFEAGANLGKAIWQGLKDGVMGGITYVTDAVGNMGDAIVGKLKGILGIHSPSTVFAGLGEMSGEGYLKGLDASMGQMSDSVPTGAFARPASGGGFGPIQVTVNVTTNVGGGSAAGGEAAGEQIGHQVAAAVESLLPGALQSAFQRMQQEAGL